MIATCEGGGGGPPATSGRPEEWWSARSDVVAVKAASGEGRSG
jgi:hypothetical protein